MLLLNMRPETRRCERCGDSFTVRAAREKRRRYCSNFCAANSRQKVEAMQRFMAKVRVDDGLSCWLWNGAKQCSGYGAFYFHGKLDRAHRVSWLLHRGVIPAGYVVMHTCDVPQCVNPDHLRLGRPVDNSRDMVAKGRHGERKLSIDQVRAIRADARRHREVAALFGVSRSLVSAIKRGDVWGEVA